jgi:hypothetical protein
VVNSIDGLIIYPVTSICPVSFDEVPCPVLTRSLKSACINNASLTTSEDGVDIYRFLANLQQVATLHGNSADRVLKRYGACFWTRVPSLVVWGSSVSRFQESRTIG